MFDYFPTFVKYAEYLFYNLYYVKLLMLLNFLTLFGALALFLFGTMIQSNGLQKILGDNVRKFLPWMKGNPAKQILAGAGLSAAVQSSSAATVTVVSYVNAGLLLLGQAVGVIFGANIGTTATAWLITLFGFTLDVRLLGFPLLCFGFFFMMSKDSKKKTISELIIGTALIFVSIFYMKKCMLDINQQGAFMEALTAMASYGFLSVFIFLLIGLLAAFILQSSSATIILALILLGSGWIPFKLAAAIVLGANIGTTITANLAAAKANIQARRAALIHLLFNTIGVAIILIFFQPFTSICQWIATFFGAEITPDFVAGESSSIASNGQLYGLCAIHTMFNLINAFILIWFSKGIVKIVTRLIKDKPEEKDSLLKYIGVSPIGSPAVSIGQAFNEVINFGQISYEGFDYVRKAVNEKDDDKFEEYRKKLVEYEEISDRMERNIANFLSKISPDVLNTEEAAEMKVVYRIIGEMESLGDSGENISRILEREKVHHRKFDEEAISNINLMIDKVDAAYKIMNMNLAKAVNHDIHSIENAFKAESEINSTREQLRNKCIAHIESQRGNYQSLNYFLDIISELESMGDFMVNISQAAIKRK